MKKICLLLAMVFALSCLPAMAAEGDAVLGVSEDNRLNFSYCFSMEDTLYLAGYAELYTYHVGDADLVEYTFDLPELGDGSYDVATLPFGTGGKLYALNLITEYGESASYYGANVVELNLQEDGSAAYANQVDVDWSDMLEDYDENTYPIRPDSIIGAAGQAIFRYYDSEGKFKVSSLDLTTGSVTAIDELDDAFSITAYKDDTLLVELYSYDSEEQVVRLVVYDPASESTQMLGDVQIEEYSPLQGLAYDPAGDTIYCLKGGEVCPVDLGSGKVGEGVTDMPIESAGSMAGCVMNGGYYVFCSDGAVIRNLDPAQSPQTRLKINDTSWNDGVTASFYRFSNAHGDVRVILSREYSEADNVRENMMNQDSSVDIYVLSTSLASYDALYKRGYLMELDGSKKAAELADRMYPALKEGLSSNGHLVAVPLSLSAWTMGVNEKALNALGKKLEDVPDNWPEFLDFLTGLAGALDDAKGITLFYSGCTVSEARFELFNNILEDYQRYVSFTDPDMGYNTDLLRGLIEKLEQIDFTALGCIPDDEADDMQEFGEYVEGSVLIQTGTGCSIGNFYSEFTPVLMRMEPGAPGFLVLDAMVAIVNPYTKNPEAALAFIDELVENMPKPTLYAVDPQLNEPIRGDMNQETVNETQEELDELRRQYEAASAEDKQSLEQEITAKEREFEDFNTNLWEVSPTEIEWYRAHDGDLHIGNYNWLYADEAGEATDLIDQYREGQISAADMLAGIDKKVQMMLMEGN